jgi:hypothetical protein
MGQSSRRIGQVDAVDPVLRLVQRHICVQCTIDLAMRKDTFSRRQRKQRATTNQFRACLVTSVAIE